MRIGPGTPAPLGAHNWHPMSFSPLTGLVYLPSQQGSRFNYVMDPNYEYKPGTWNTGAAQAECMFIVSAPTACPARIASPVSELIQSRFTGAFERECA